MYRFFLILLCTICVQARIADKNGDVELPTNELTEQPKTEANITVTNENKITSIDNITIESTSKKENIELRVNLEVTSPSNQSDATHIVDLKTKQPNVGEPLILTGLIKRGKTNQARKASKVSPDLFFGLASHSGFLTVDEKYNSNLFFWYFPVPEKPVAETPWIIWLQGGPGVSSLLGLFYEIGPITVDANAEIKLRRESWGKEHSILFIDNPVGSGYSFTDDESGYAQHTNTSSAQLYLALQQFLQIFPELRNAPLFIAGESYAGKYIPGLAYEIHKRKKTQDRINLQGLAIGNGFIDPLSIANYSRIAYHFGLIDADGVKTIQGMERSYVKLLNANNSIAAKKQWQAVVITLHTMAMQTQLYNFLKDDLGLRHYETFLRRPEIKRAIHVGNVPYSSINMTVNAFMAADFLSNFKPVVEELLEHYRVLIYSGQLDMMIPYTLTAENIRTWRWSGSEKFAKALRHPWICMSKTCAARVSGFHKSGGNLTEVLVRGAGHTVPSDQPAAARELIEKFIKGEELSGRSLMEIYDNFKKQIRSLGGINL